MQTCIFYMVLTCMLRITQSCNASTSSPLKENLQDTKYILIWDGPTLAPMTIMGEGFSAFTKHRCPHTNCFVTSNRKLLKDVTEYDAILFNGRSLSSVVPKKRSAKQKYVYVNKESPHYYPVCDSVYSDFFNWTWTYKLDSDLQLFYLKICDLNGNEVAPKIDMHWSELGAVDNGTKDRLQRKGIAAAWFVSNCRDKSGRLEFVHEIKKEFKKYGHTIHTYGSCGARSCPFSKVDECNRMIANDYFFYLAFENSFGEDYVTEKVLNALRNYAVPVVFGASNYSRFLPPNSYLDARALGPAALAARMAAVIANYRSGRLDAYYDFFRWRSRYSIDCFSQTKADKEFICQMCSVLNNPETMSKHTVYKNFTKWWNNEQAICSSSLSNLLNEIGKLVTVAKYYCLDWLNYLVPSLML